MGNDNLHPEIKGNPVIRIAIDMDPGEVIKKSSYPLDFSLQDQPFVDKAFKYGNLIVTANVDFEILGPHKFSIKQVRYWGATTQFDKINSFSADAPNLTIDEAILRAKQWVADIENAGWVRQKFLYAIPERRNFNNWSELREAFLLLGDRKILGVAVGEWRSQDEKQRLSISITHKREDGGPRSADSPEPKDGENDRNYLLRFGIGYSDKVRDYRSKHLMELRKEALKNP
ncbi:MAG: hypothetical protein RL497_651 [Pseudomonadota bacterium]